MKKYRDHYFKRAKQENYPARSVYKLQEIEKRFKLFRPGQTVIDLGAAPGSWSMFAAKKVEPGGRVMAVDIQDIVRIGTKLPDNVTVFCEDVFERSDAFEAEFLKWTPFDIVLSDMAPNTTGNKFTDQARSMNLAEEALLIARDHLKPGGHFVVKVFMGPDDEQYVKEMRTLFAKVKTFKPKSSRAESKEIFYIGCCRTGGCETA